MRIISFDLDWARVFFTVGAESSYNEENDFCFFESMTS
jgi:hypothetical protein